MALPRELLLATRSAGKLAEFQGLLAPTGVRVLSLTDIGVVEAAEEDRIEVGTTFEENARLKATYFRSRTGGGLPVLADDSGLCVAALGGAPGVYSRRYAGATGPEADVSRANTSKLLHSLEGVTDRAAEFVCVVAYVDATREFVADGRVPGRILDAPLGAAGFGYDPVFWSDELEGSFGAASASAKARVSHRARAVARLIAALQADAGARERGARTVDAL